MSLYTRHQIIVLLLVLGVAGAGLAVGQWRRLHPELVERLERFDRASEPEGEPARAEGGAAPARAPRRSKPPAAAPEPRTESQPPSPEGRIDLNTAALDDLTRLPGVGPVLAGRIVEARPYASVDDVRRVKGVGRSKFERLRELISVTEQ